MGPDRCPVIIALPSCRPSVSDTNCTKNCSTFCPEALKNPTTAPLLEHCLLHSSSHYHKLTQRQLSTFSSALRVGSTSSEGDIEHLQGFSLLNFKMSSNGNISCLQNVESFIPLEHIGKTTHRFLFKHHPFISLHPRGLSCGPAAQTSPQTDNRVLLLIWHKCGLPVYFLL